VTSFTTGCGKCFCCKQGVRSRREKCQTLGTVVLDGDQAEYCRFPLADGTIVTPPVNIEEYQLGLMADISPMACFAAAKCVTRGCQGCHRPKCGLADQLWSCWTMFV
ncbi:hypothetical protein A1O7_00019, partial [Cladophialophora yegresii CBS 114405]